MDFVGTWKKFVNEANKRGIPVPTARDPKTGIGSVSFTLVCVSFGLMAICILMAMAMVVEKWTNFFGAMDTSLTTIKEAFSMSLQMAGLSAGLYFGRKFQKDEKGAISVDSNTPPDSQNP